MRRILLLFILLFSLQELAICQSRVIDTIGSTPVYIDSLLGFGTTADQWPWDVEWGADHHLWFTVKDQVRRYDTATHQVQVVLNRADTTSNAMSITFHPAFPAVPWVYVTYDIGGYYYSYSAGPVVLYRYTYNSVNGVLENETEILRWSHSGEHSGGRLHTGIDGYIYCTTSEYAFAADTAGSLNGKILRINPDGSIPAINSSGNYPISYGHRNPQGIVQVPNGHLIISELGQHIDELNLILDYRNYGWPAYDGDQCFNTSDSCTSATFQYVSPIDTAIRPPSGIAWYGSFAIPELNGCILQCILSSGGAEGGLVASRLNPALDDVLNDVHYFKGEYKRFRDVTVSPDGKIYVITNDRTQPVIRVIYNPDAQIGIEEFSTPGYTLYPNPAMEWIRVISTQPIGKWQLITPGGCVIAEGNTPEVTITLSLENIAAGMYIFRTQQGSRKWVRQ